MQRLDSQHQQMHTHTMIALIYKECKTSLIENLLHRKAVQKLQKYQAQIKVEEEAILFSHQTCHTATLKCTLQHP